MVNRRTFWYRLRFHEVTNKHAPFHSFVALDALGSFPFSLSHPTMLHAEARESGLIET